MSNQRVLLLSFVISALLGGFAGAAHADPQLAAQSATAYSVKASDIVVPNDVPVGQYRRTIRPFGNWTLICDENLKQKHRVCNVTQSIVDRSGAVVFSWSLAATREGKPIMILRANRSVGAGKPIQIGFVDGKGTLVAKTSDCDARICMALLPVDAYLRKRIDSGALAQITYSVAVGSSDGQRPVEVFFNAPLHDLAAALAAI